MAPWTCQRIFLGSLVVIFTANLLNSVSCDVTEQTNRKCNGLCKAESARVAQSHQKDCQRGCRYFNIEFLTSVTYEDSKSELGNVLEQCQTLCKDAYPADGMRRDACHLGCRRMSDVQSQAPIADGLIVYMGASAGDRSMLVVQPPDLLESGVESDWVLLNSFRPDTFKLSETHVQTMPISDHGRRDYRHLHTPFCIPAWLWMIPVMLLMALVYIQYGTSLKSALVEDSEDELEQEILLERNGEEIVAVKDKDTFLISFQPLDYLEAKLKDLPPKYDEGTSSAGN